MDFTPRPNEFKVDSDGFVTPTHGISVFDNAESVASKGFDPYELDVYSLPSELQIIQRGANINHYEIVPSEPATLTPSDYVDKLSQIRTKN